MKLTDRERAIRFLKKNKIEFAEKKNSRNIILLNVKLTFSGFDFGINPIQPPSWELYFDKADHWHGGIPEIWNTPPFAKMIR